MKKTLGMAFIILSLFLGIGFKIMLVDPAMQRLPNGHYGEMYGPIMYFKMPVYMLLAFTFTAGLGLLIWDNVQKNKLRQTVS